MKYLIFLLLFLTSCASRIVITYETQEAVYGKSSINKDQENEKATPSTLPSDIHF